MTNQSTNTTSDRATNNQPTVNERLEEITSDLWVKYGRPGTMDEFVPEAKQAIASLIRELVS